MVLLVLGTFILNKGVDRNGRWSYNDDRFSPFLEPLIQVFTPHRGPTDGAFLLFTKSGIRSRKKSMGNGWG